MSRANSLEARIEQRIRRSSDGAFVLADFFDLSDRDQILRALRKLIEKNLLIRMGQGVYAKARTSSLTQKVVPEQSLRTIAVTILRKVGVRVLPTQYERDYEQGKSTQIPTGLVIGVDRRVNRKIGYNGRFVKYEQLA